MTGPAIRPMPAICDCGTVKQRASDSTCVACLRARVTARLADGDYEGMNEREFCTSHGLPLMPGEYGHYRSSYCADCEPPEPDGEVFRGGEAAGYRAEQQLAAMRLK